MDDIIVAIFLLLSGVFFFVNRNTFADKFYGYYQDIYEPEGPWWRNGSWRPSKRVSHLIIDSVSVAFVLVVVIILIGL